MYVFVINRLDEYSYCDNYKAVLIAKDELNVEMFARMNIEGWRNAKLEVIRIDINNLEFAQNPIILSVENVGA